MATNIPQTSIDTVSTIATGLQAVLTLLGISSGVGAIITAAIAAVKVAPEIIGMLQQDVEMYANGAITQDELAAKFLATQTAFESAAARWKASPST